MEERDRILIERYLAGELTASERLDFEQRMKDDPVFGQEVSEFEIARKALQLKHREELKQRFTKRDELLDKKKPEEPSSDKNRLTWLWVSSVIIIVLVIWGFFFSNNPQTVPVPSESIDTSRFEQYPSVHIDTIELKDTLSVQQQTPKPKEMQPEMASNHKKGEELFAEYFKPYKDAMMDPTTRGDEELLPLQKYQKAYWDEEYQKAVESFSGLTPDQQSNDNYRFSYANALLATGRTSQAIPILETIIKNNRSRYVVESYYALALAHVKNGDIAKSKQYVVTYLKENKVKKGIEAQKFNQSLD